MQPAIHEVLTLAGWLMIVPPVLVLAFIALTAYYRLQVDRRYHVTGRN